MLDQRTARKELRKLWRPNFESAVGVARKLERLNITAAERARHEEWLRVWEQRGTLETSVLLWPVTDWADSGQYSRSDDELEWLPWSHT